MWEENWWLWGDATVSEWVNEWMNERTNERCVVDQRESSGIHHQYIEYTTASLIRCCQPPQSILITELQWLVVVSPPGRPLGPTFTQAPSPQTPSLTATVHRVTHPPNLVVSIFIPIHRCVSYLCDVKDITNYCYWTWFDFWFFSAVYV